MPDMDDLGEVMIERRRLIALAYRLLGTVEEAEDAVQETYLRWYRLSDDERAAIDNPLRLAEPCDQPGLPRRTQVGAQPPGEVRRPLAARAGPAGFPERPPRIRPTGRPWTTR